MNDSTYTTSASGKTNPTKVVLRAAEASISGSGDYRCASFFRFPPMLPGISTTAAIHSSAFVEGRKRSRTVQGEPPASVLLTLPSRSRSARAVRTGLSEACLEAVPSAALWSVSASFHLSLCNACPASTCNAKSLLFYPTLDLISLAAVKGWLSKADSRAAVTHQTSGRTRNA